MKVLARSGNVAPGISVEGFKEHTGKRRGQGVYGKVMKTMDLLKTEGVIFGISVTYTSENIDLITTDEFVQYYINKGAIFAWYFMFMPVGKDPILELVPTPEQRVYCGDRVAELRKKHPIRETTILEASNSPFFKAIRREFPYNDITNLKRPCMIIDNPQVLRKVMQEHLVPQGHRHSEDIINDPDVVDWIDRCAGRFNNLTDQVWL